MDTGDDLQERAVAALVREWGISDADARDAILRVRCRESRLGVKVALEWTWDDRCDAAS